MSKTLRLLYHVTAAHNLPVIMRRGLLTELAIGRIRGVWLTTWEHLWWMVPHVCSRHRIDPEEVRVIAVLVREKYLVHHREDIYYSHISIKPGQFGEIITFDELVNMIVPFQPINGTHHREAAPPDTF